MSKARVLWTLFVRMLLISTFVLGGGFAIIAVADEVFSKRMKWTEEGEILGQLPVFQMVPGMICTNTAIYIGNKMAGALGAAVALAGTVLPSIVIFMFVTICYDRIPVGNIYLEAAFTGLRASLAGIVAAMVVRGWVKCVDGVYGYLTVAVAVVLIAVLGFSAVPVIAVAAVGGVSLECARGVRAGGRSGRVVFRSVPWTLPLLFLKYGLVAFGGGYVLVPLYVEDFVGSSAPYLQIAAEEFANVMALTQLTPGSVSVNCATFFGYRMSGVFGSLIATLAMVLPNYVLLLLVLRFLDRFKSSLVVRGIIRGIRPVTMSLMLTAMWTFAGMSIWSVSPGTGLRFDAVSVAVAVLTLAAMLARKLNVVQLIFGSAVFSPVCRMIAGQI